MAKQLLVVFFLVFILLGTILFWPLEYRAFEYKRQGSSMAYGFESRKWLFGEWHKDAYGADSWQEAERWIAMQPKRGGF